MYDAAIASFYAGGTYSILSLISNGVAEQVASSGGWGTLITQLGVFGIVVVVFKFMLGRQDARDEKNDAKDKEALEKLRSDKAAVEAELKMEREKHDQTRQQLINVLRDAKISNKE